MTDNRETPGPWALYRFSHDGRPEYVAQRCGDGGVDWGYTSNESQAGSFSDYWRKRFCADMRRCNTVGYAILSGRDK